MGKSIRVLSSSQAAESWPSIEPLLNRALKYNSGEFSLSDILSGVLLGRFKVVAMSKDGKLHSISIVEIINYPQKRVLNIAFLASNDMEDFKDEFTSFIERYAKLCRCDSIQAHGRQGWERVLSKYGFNKIYTVLEKVV